MGAFVKKAIVLYLCCGVLFQAGGIAAAAAEVSPPAELPGEQSGEEMLESQDVPGLSADGTTGGNAVLPGTTDGTGGEQTSEESSDLDGDSDEDLGLEEGTSPEGTAPTEPDGEQENAVDEYCVTLTDCTIGAGEIVTHTTVSSEFAGRPMQEGYYPGELTVELAGQIVIEAGGSLEIGTLSIGGPEASPVITGTGQIVVKAGGQLRLNSVTFAPQSQAPMIIQEMGGSVSLDGAAAEEGIVQWSGLLVNNLYDNPDDIWIETGTVLTGDMLPASMWVVVQEKGRERDMEVSLLWDMSGYDGRTEGDLVITGQFLDETGQSLSSLLPLEVAVHWYQPGTLAVTSAEWKGSTVPTVELVVQELPEYAEVWGEISVDGGTTWIRWANEDQFFVVESESGGWACIFAEIDKVPGLYRVIAEDPWADEYACWRSAAIAVSPPEDSNDSGGNRGGSTTPDVPDREPEPVPRPDRPQEPDDFQPEQPETGEPEDTKPEITEPDLTPGDIQPEDPAPQEPGGEETQTAPNEMTQQQVSSEDEEHTVNTQKTSQTNQSSGESHPEHLIQTDIDSMALFENPEEDSTSQDIPESETADEDEAHTEQPVEESSVNTAEGQTAAQQSTRTLSRPVQFLLVAAGLAACAAVAAVASGIFRKKK